MSQRIIFLGTPPFAVYCLKKILEEKINVVAVVTAPDRPAGRGRKISESAVKQFAVGEKIPVLQPTNLKDPQFVEQLRSLSPDLMVVVAFRMLPELVWSIPSHGTFNLHASLLPDYRGAAPINWAIINQEKFSGVTTFFINEEIDSGAILLQERVAIEAEETAGSLHDKLARTGAALIVKTIHGIFEGTLVGEKQPWKGNEPLAPKLDKENVFLNWDEPLTVIQAKIRGLSPYPGARTIWVEDDKESVVKIFEAVIIKENHQIPPKKIIFRDKKILIAHPSGFLDCSVLQLPNKKRMEAKTLLNGMDLSSIIRVK